MVKSDIPSEIPFLSEVEDFPVSDIEGEQDFVRSIVFNTRLTPLINRSLNRKLRADWGIMEYNFDGNQGLHELDIAIYQNDSSVRVWNGSVIGGEQSCNIRVAKLEPSIVKVIIECKKNINPGNTRVWTRLGELAGKLEYLKKRLWLIAETCNEDDIGEARSKAYALGYRPVFIFHKRERSGEIRFNRADWARLFSTVRKVRVG